MRLLLLFLLVLTFNTQASDSYWIDKGVDFAVGAGASYVGNKLANSDNNKQTQPTQTPIDQVIRVDGLSLICKWATGRNTLVGCWHDENHEHYQPATYLAMMAGKNARFVRMFYMKDYAIIQYTLVK